MKFAFLVVLVVVIAQNHVEANGGRGGKGGKGRCGDKASPCADGSKPLCQDGSQPDKSQTPPSCSAGGNPVCNDGTEPRARELDESKDGDRDVEASSPRGSERGKDDDDDDCGGSDKKLGLILGASVGGGVLLLSLCCCAYCWRRRRRAAVLSNRKNEAQNCDTVVGKAVDGCVQIPEDLDTKGAVVVGQLPSSLKHEPSSAAAIDACENVDIANHVASSDGEAV